MGIRAVYRARTIPQHMHVRPYYRSERSDRSDVERIHFETGFLGSSMGALLSDRTRWNAKIAWYLDEEPESAFVLESGSRVLGYLVGCLDDAKHGGARPVSALTSLVSDALLSLRLPQDRRFWLSRFGWIGDMLIGRSGELGLKTPSNTGHLHINLSPEARGRGYGTQMLGAFEAHARERGVSTIHAESFETDRNPNASFWKRNGFEVYSRVPTTYWKRFTDNEPMHLVSYSKNLSTRA